MSIFQAFIIEIKTTLISSTNNTNNLQFVRVTERRSNTNTRHTIEFISAGFICFDEWWWKRFQHPSLLLSLWEDTVLSTRGYLFGVSSRRIQSRRIAKAIASTKPKTKDEVIGIRWLMVNYLAITAVFIILMVVENDKRFYDWLSGILAVSC